MRGLFGILRALQDDYNTFEPDILPETRPSRTAKPSVGEFCGSEGTVLALFRCSYQERRWAKYNFWNFVDRRASYQHPASRIISVNSAKFSKVTHAVLAEILLFLAEAADTALQFLRLHIRTKIKRGVAIVWFRRFAYFTSSRSSGGISASAPGGGSWPMYSTSK